MNYTGRVNVRQLMLAFFQQVFCVPDPDAGLAGAGGFVMPQMTVQRFNKFDSFTQGNAQGFFGLLTKLLKVFHAVIPTAIARSVAVITSFAGRLEHVLMGVIPILDQFLDHLARIQKRFYELLLHWRSPLGCHFILGESAGDLNRCGARMSK
jgi:hypothetical protein